MKSGSNYLRKPKTDVDRALKNMEKSKRRRQIEAERKKFRRNQQPKGPRRKSWGIEDADEADLTAFERIMPRDEGERRRMLEQAAQARNGGAQVDEQAEDGAPSRKPGASPNGADTVVRAGLVVEFGSGLPRGYRRRGGRRGRSVQLAALAEQESGFTNPVAVGDRVTVRLDGPAAAWWRRFCPGEAAGAARRLQRICARSRRQRRSTADRGVVASRPCGWS